MGQQNNLRNKQAELYSAKGMSVIELLIVVVVLGIMAAISVPYLVNYRDLYRSEEQAKQIMDLMREGSQTALNERRTIRMEIDVTANEVHLIDENGGNPDTIIKSVPIEPAGVLRVEVQPSGITPPTPPNYPAALFATDATGHLRGGTPVIGNRVWAMRFRSDGSVVTAGNVPISATLYVFPAAGATSDVAAPNEQIRAVTLYGGSGAVRFWRYNGTTFSAQ